MCSKILALLLLTAPVLAADLTVSNRAPKPNEVGYRPADGESVRQNPPSLIWLHESPAVTYTVQWARQSDFKHAVTVDQLPFNTTTHSAPLATGEWFWRYRFTTRDGKDSGWSATRRFIVPADAVEFPMPNRVQQRERVPAGHPRLFMRPEDLPRLRQLAAGENAKQFAPLRAEAEKLLPREPTPEPAQFGSARNKEDKAAIQFWWPNREQTLRACQEAETLAFVYLITREKKFGEAARKWILHLASWDPDGPTNFRLNCEAGKPLLYRLPRAYDWAWDALTPEDRVQVQTVMQRRIKDAWESGEVGRAVGHLNSPYSSHGNRTWHKVGEAGLAFLGEIPEAETWLDYAVNKFHAIYPVWADDDGGWHEGVSYWAGYLSKAVWWLQASQSALGMDGFKKPFFSQVGDFPLYVAPPGSPNCGFGDLAFRPASTGWGPFMEYFLRAGSQSTFKNNAAYWRWWTEQWKMNRQAGILGFLYQANLPPLPPGKAPADLPPSKVFHGIGVASLHTTLLDSAADVHFLFKSSPFGSQSHGHNPQNSFQLNAYGEALLTTCVYRDLHGSKFHYQWAHSTVAHNAVLVNGQGQVKHTAALRGRIAEFHLTPQLDYVMGDAAEAYGGRLDRYRRHVAFVKDAAGPVIVLFDELVAKEPSTFEFMLHAFNPFTVDEKQARLSVEQPKAGLTAAYLSPAPLSFRQWDGYDPQPDKEFPNQWHVQAGTREPRKEIGVLTILVPHRAGQGTEWTAERLESDSAVGARIQRAGKPVTVAFRKATAQGTASLTGMKFDGAVSVR